MGLWDSVGDPEQKANESGGNGFFYPGEYLVTIECTKHRTKAKGARKETFVIEARVLGVRSSNPKAPGVGDKRDHIITGFGGEYHEMAVGDVKAFTNAVFGGEAVTSQWTLEQWKAAGAKVDGEGLKGLPMRLECWPNQNGFTKHKWTRASAADYAEFGVQPPAAQS